MAMVLPGCDELFLRYLGPWYSEADWARRVYQATRPDIEQLGVDSELTASDISRLTEESQADVAERVCGMCEAATWDWAKLLKVRGTPSSQWIAEFDRHFQRRQIQEIIDRSDPQEIDNDYVVLCCELGTVLGTVLSSLEPRLAWLYDWPYWESGLYDQNTRSRINVFHCAVRRLSKDGAHASLAVKMDECRKLLHKTS